MDSPETTAKTNTAASSSSAAAAAASTVTATSSSSSLPVQESPFSNYASNLSPIKPVKSLHGLQGLLGFNSPPLVFTSPHTNAPKETSFLRRLDRLPCHQSPSAEISQNDNGGRNFVDGPGDLENSGSLLHGGLVTNTRKDNDTRSSLQVQPSSSLGCVDEYLTNAVDVDHANSTYGVNTDLKQASDMLQSSVSGRTESKDTLPTFDDKNDRESKVEVSVDMFGEAEENIHGKSTDDIKPIKNEKNKTRGIGPSNECSNIESHSYLDHASKRHQSKNSNAQNEGSGPRGQSNCPVQLLPEPLQTIQIYEDSHEIAGAIPHGPRSNTMHDTEASKQQCGMSRRCLQFADAQSKATVDSTNPSKKSNDVTGSRSPVTPVQSESLDSSFVDLNVAYGKMQLVNLPKPVTPMFPPRDTGKSPLTVSKPLGIGLHLNSILNPPPKGHGATVGVKLASAEHEMLENKASVTASSLISESFDDTVSLNWLPQVDHNATPHTQGKFDSEQIDSFEEYSQLSPTNERKKSSSTVDGDDYKHCNCKKTRCLKLYCDCFAAGFYCAELCACQGCSNRREYEDTVLDARQQIESRDPLAFAPKIVKQGAEFPDDGNLAMPSSARHKRGCNCKKSMCLKKYCECYQANVGCSSGCRCEGCKNVYGRKEEYIGNEEMMSSRAISEGTSDAKLEMVINKKDILHVELYDANSKTPPTPSFQCSDHGKDALQSQTLSSRYVPSPESDLTTSYAKSLRSLKNLESNEMFLETSKEILEVDAYGRGRNYNSTDVVDQFSSRCHELADLCDSLPAPDFPSTAMASSASSKATDWTNVSRLQLCPRSGNLSSGGSLRWRCSPITPVSQLGGTKSLQALDSAGRLGGILEDDIPEILKEASTPIKSVKVSSPSHKRVSPPHSRANQLGSSSSGALKSGRKFILKAVPSFPPLTPALIPKKALIRKEVIFKKNKRQ